MFFNLQNWINSNFRSTDYKSLLVYAVHLVWSWPHTHSEIVTPIRTISPCCTVCIQYNIFDTSSHITHPATHIATCTSRDRSDSACSQPSTHAGTPRMIVLSRATGDSSALCPCSSRAPHDRDATLRRSSAMTNASALPP